MLRRHRRKPEPSDLELTTFLNMMVVLIAFLLVTAVFSKISIQELKLPTAAGGSASNKPLVTIEVIVRKNRLEIGDGKRVIASMPKSGDQYDLPKLSQHLQDLKARHSEKTDAMLLVEPDIAYEDMVRVMDAVKAVRVRQPAQPGQPGPGEVKVTILFPDLSVGDAP
jgi:biopolymer transport protein ExbD